jgi:hypothetical protein
VTEPGAIRVRQLPQNDRSQDRNPDDLAKTTLHEPAREEIQNSAVDWQEYEGWNESS